MAGTAECTNNEGCSDREECTEDICDRGVCRSTPFGDGVPCDENNECTEGVCASGACDFTPIADGTACDEKNECTAATCVDGTCDIELVADGTGCGNDAGTCQQGSCQVACTEQGIRDAIAAGGGPYTFGCAGPQTVVTEAEIVIDKDVILDGEGKLTVDGNDQHRVFSTAGGDCEFNPNPGLELRGFTVTRGRATSAEADAGGGILNYGNLILVDCSVRGNSALDAGGIGNFSCGNLMLMNTTVSGNIAETGGGGIGDSAGLVILINGTISGNTAGNRGGGIWSDNGGVLVANSTMSENSASIGTAIWGEFSSFNSIVDGDCAGTGASNGHNVESPGNTCGFGLPTDQVNIAAEQLALGPLQDNGGPTMTHALLTEPTGSVAVDKIPEADCVDADGQPLTTDQRGEPRPETGGAKCDVGAFEVQP